MYKNYILLTLLFYSTIFSQEKVESDSIKIIQNKLFELNKQIEEKDILISKLNSNVAQSSESIKNLNKKLKEIESEKSNLSFQIDEFKNNEELAKKNQIEFEEKSQKLNIRIEKQTENEQILLNSKIVFEKNQKELSSKLKEVSDLEALLLEQKQNIEKKQLAVDEKFSVARTNQIKELYILYILLGSILAIAFLSFLLRQVYLWRKKIDGNSIILPEQVNDSFENSRKDISLLIKKIGELSNISSESTKVNSKYFIDINDALNPLKDTIASQRDEIKRLQGGYDNKIKKRFVSRLIDLRNRVVFYTTKENGFSNDVLDATNNILKIVDYMFKTEGIEALTVEHSASLENIDADQFEILEENAVETVDRNLVGKVKDTISPCYFLNGEDSNKEVIKKGIIEFYKLKGS